MTGGDANSFALRDKSVLQFAPHFSVYLMSSDTVCLYSEDRKFLLHGELYCALAGAITKGGRTVRELVRGLEHDFAAAQIQEALQRLVDRGYVIAAAPSSRGTVAAYWASLGLQPEAAKRNLQQCRARIRAFDVEGESELDAALSKLGVRVVKRSPDITVLLVSDYFDGRLPKLNQRHLEDGTRWVLTQPSGIFPLVGPVFSPGKGACWRCLADRMIRNREVKAMLDRDKARPLAVSPLAHHTLGQSAIQLAAIELAKAFASQFRTDLSNNVISLDLLGSTIVRHHVARRPQCPACGRLKLRDPRRPPVPISVASGGRPVMTSGGYRTISSRDTVARFRKHVSPLTGVVSRLEPIEADLPLNTNYIARHNFSAPAKSIYELRGGVGGCSFGKGSTAEQGEASALMEAIERYSGIFQGDEIRTAKRFTDLPPGDAIPPNHVLLYSDAQYQRGLTPMVDAGDAPLSPALFDPSAKIEWSPVWSLRDKRFRYLPTSVLYFFYQGSVAFLADSNGCAAGNTREEAIVQGFLELVERDAYAIWWYNRLQRPAVDVARFDDPFVRELYSRLTNAGRRLWVLDVTSDLGIPTFVAVTHWMQNDRENIEFGSGSHFDARIALLRTLTELNQFLSLGLMGGGTGEKSSLDGETPLCLVDHPFLTPNDTPAAQPDFDTKFGHLGTDEQVTACVRVAERHGLDFLVLDQTRPDIETPVVRVIVPGLRHFYRRFAAGRLYDVPVKLGLRDRPLEEDELNPIHPHT
ncbi:MAG: TOMM precursor leader peptide-binding protein [Methylovirgula sp.]